MRIVIVIIMVELYGCMGIQDGVVKHGYLPGEWYPFRLLYIISLITYIICFSWFYYHYKRNSKFANNP